MSACRAPIDTSACCRSPWPWRHAWPAGCRRFFGGSGPCRSPGSAPVHPDGRMAAANANPIFLDRSLIIQRFARKTGGNLFLQRLTAGKSLLCLSKNGIFDFKYLKMGCDCLAKFGHPHRAKPAGLGMDHMLDLIAAACEFRKCFADRIFLATRRDRLCGRVSRQERRHRMPAIEHPKCQTWL